MSYTDVFGADTVPPSQAAYALVTLTANTTLVWPDNYAGSDTVASSIMDVTSASAGLSMLLPPANEVGPGRDVLIRNTGANSFSVKDNASNLIVTIAAGASKYIYLTDNTASAGVWGSVAFGVGTSTVDAATLVGYGIKAISTTLNQSHPTVAVGTDLTVDSTYRAKLVLMNGGVATVSFSPSATLGDDFFVLIRNAGTGTITLDPNASETIDGQTTLTVQPGESLMVCCSGSALYSVGYGRSTVYQFTQLVKDVTAYSGGSVTLTASEASNKLLTFTGNPASAVTVIVPSVVAVYYTQNSLSTAVSVTVKTASYAGVAIPQGQRIITICDGSYVVSAQSAQASTSITLIDGTYVNPALAFASSTDTGLFKYSTDGVGISSNGAEVAHFDTATGSQITGALTVTTNLSVNGNTALGNASGDTLTVAPSAVTWSNNPTHSGDHTFSGNLTSTAGSRSFGATQFSGNITSSGNPSLNLGTGALTAGSAALTNLDGTYSSVTVDSGGRGLSVRTSDFNGSTTGTDLRVYLNSQTGNTTANIAAFQGGGSSAYSPISINGGQGTFSSTGLSLGSLGLTAGAGTFNTNVALGQSSAFPATGLVHHTNNFAYLIGGSSGVQIANQARSKYLSIDDAASTITIRAAAGTDTGVFSSTGLAVTGNTTSSASTGTNSNYLRCSNTGGNFYVGRDNSAGNDLAVGSSAYAGVIAVPTAHSLHLATNNTVRATLDASGNLGLGVTPSAWGAFKALEINRFSVASTGTETEYLHNAHWNGSSWIYKATDFATRMRNVNGQFQWYTAPSGTAGNAITFTQAMTLDASGNLLVGETTNNSFSARLALSYDSGTTSWAVGPWVSQPTKFYISANATTNGVYLNGTTATSWSALSDARFKTDLEDITDALSKVLTLSAVTGCYVGSEVRHPFLIAQEVQAVLPEAVDTSDPNKLGLSYTDTIPLLVAAIKELSAKNDALEARLAALEAK